MGWGGGDAARKGECGRVNVPGRDGGRGRGGDGVVPCVRCLRVGWRDCDVTETGHRASPKLLRAGWGVDSNRNPLLFGMLHRMEAVEHIGSGIRRIHDLCREWGVPAPLFDVPEHWLTVTFRRLPLGGDRMDETSRGSGRDQVGTRSGPGRDQVGTKSGFSVRHCRNAQ